MANTRPYTREELKGLRRADLQKLFKTHNLKGANGNSAYLIDTLIDYFASPVYLEAFPPPASSQPSQGPAKSATARSERLVRPIPTRPAGARGPTSVKRKTPGTGVRAASRATSAAKAASVDPVKAAASEKQLAGLAEEGDVAMAETAEEPVSLPPKANSQLQSPTIALSDVQALLKDRDARWEMRLDGVEKRLGDEVERLRKEVAEMRLRYEELEKLDKNRVPRGWGALAGPSHTPRVPSSVGPGRPSQPYHHRSASLPFSSLGKRRHPPEHTVESDESGLKRVRFNGNGEPSRSGTEPPGQPRTPSPKKATSSFPPDFFAPQSSNAPAATQNLPSIAPRTPSPSRQGTLPDNSQTPRVPLEWQNEPRGMTPMRTPFRVEQVPEFATTPELPMRDLSPSMDSVTAGARLTPGRVLSSTHGAASDISDKDEVQIPGRSAETPSAMSGLERIDESEESPPLPPRRTASPANQLRFPSIKPPSCLGIGMSGSPSSSSPKPGRRAISQPNQPTTPSLLGQHSMLAPPAIISRDSRAGSERPPITARARTQSPPPRPRSASAINRPPYSRGATPSSRHVSPAIALSNVISEEEGPRVRSASADYMRIAMFGLEGGVDSVHPEAPPSSLTDVAEDTVAEFPAGDVETEAWYLSEEVVTPGHRTLLGTERYNDTRFGDMPVGIWTQPRIDFGTPGAPS